MRPISTFSCCCGDEGDLVMDLEGNVGVSEKLVICDWIFSFISVETP